ncbi:MAG TPA: EAL domain-containing protein [Pyrinomonadaceae bacterium]|nr:EAL domain-containing protein [Pyrinomonadaceae bacterium]
MWLALSAGLAAVAYSAALTPFRADLVYLLLTLSAVTLGARLFVRAGWGARVPLSDAFVVFALLQVGAGQAVVLAALAALCAPARCGRGMRGAIFDAGAASSATLLCALALRSVFGESAATLAQTPPTTFVPALFVVALFLTAAHALGHAFAGGFASDGPEGERGLFDRVASTFAGCFAVAAGAGFLASLVPAAGFDTVVASAACAAILFSVTRLRVETAGAATTPAPAEGGRRAERASEDAGGGMFREAFEGAAAGMALVSAKGKFLQVNRALLDVLGYEEQALVAKTFQDVAHADDLAPALSGFKRLLGASESSHECEMRLRRASGEDVWVLLSAARAGGRKSSARLVFQVQDITERKRSEEQLLHDAFHDPLTKLPNRALFIDHVKLTIARAKRRPGHLFAVLFLDLDRFKIVNDSLGHMFGDQLLVGIARRLEGCLREGDTVARVGGDEFTILLEDIEDEIEAISVAERIQKELSAPFHIGGHEVFTTVSIGIAPSSTDYDDPEDILRDADTAMYRAKSLGKARHEVFDKAMHALAVNLLQLETDLRRALERKEFFVHYQPIVALSDFRLCGFEALVRWQHPERGLISPMDFIPVAEDTGQIIAIGEWTLMEACRQMRRWQKQYPSDVPLYISVNLSGKQFTQPNLIERVRTIVEKTKLDPRSLKLEITESVVMENIETATEMLKDLRALGVQLSIDDFGTGYSSLSYLHRFPIDTLKIDRSFVTRMVENNENSEIVRTIVMLAQTLGMDVVAEGVETKEQLALLRKLGCESGQGYYFSRPATVNGAEQLIAATSASVQRALNMSKARPAPEADDKVKTMKFVNHEEAAGVEQQSTPAA